jgi:hypothetical protein
LKRFAVFAALAASIMVLPASSSARTDCSTSDATQSVAGITVGVTAGGAGTTGQGTAVGGCVDGLSSVTPGFDGGLVEAGTAAGGVYAIVDGDDTNTAVSDQGGGYAGVSNVETGGSPEACNPNTDTGSGTNSGGCLSIRNIAAVPLPLLACGNSSGKSWENSQRDGCTIP